MARDVFLSYKTDDKEAAERLCAALERQDILCWMAPRDIPPGQQWAASIVEGLQQCKAFVLLLSSHSVAAKQIAREAELADTQNLPIFTFRLEDIQPPMELLYFLGNIQWLDGFGGQFDSAATRLAEVIRGQATGRETTRTTASAPPAALAIVEAKRSRYLIPVVATALVLVAAGAWFGLRGGSAKPTSDGKAISTHVEEVDKMSEAKAVSERYLQERDSGNYEAAWKEYTTSFRNRVSETSWQTETDHRNRNHGGVREHQFRNCRSSQTDVYVCEYTLVFADGSHYKNELWVVKSDAGTWAIDKGKVSE